jgi:hypothetical protein
VHKSSQVRALVAKVKVMSEEAITNLVMSDEWMVAVLKEAESLCLPDWMIGAGFLRNKVWDHLHGIQREVADTKDIDLIYFDSGNQNEEEDRLLSARMKGRFGLDWEIVNQAYTHKWHSRKLPYQDSTEALSEWVETATCVAVTLQDGHLKIVAPLGITDLVNLIVRPSPTGDPESFTKRYRDKNWLKKWPKLKIVNNGETRQR